ncbi:hypothetical protein M413DRAFT_170736 [Hebeloma cylindrosporum]|uniref:Ribonuclease H1 N-terminal domain-containing protein n=1 Tax=Hebeloma cylindrosporum TaxID=76867 RepID=A0A0C3C7E3_HEBCY|nr:hypothetical protein M413DRAFT_170736 [Hebeloma cylindrosporum h7]
MMFSDVKNCQWQCCGDDAHVSNDLGVFHLDSDTHNSVHKYQHMAKRKWYVVTVGRDIGVFPTWLEVGPLVKGVPNALHQSFPTEAEARRIFSKERAKGNTKIVDSNEQLAYSTPRNNSFHENENESSKNINIGHSHTESSIIITPGSSSPRPPRTYAKAHSSENFTSYTHGINPSPSPISRSASEPSPSIRRFEIIDSLFNKGSPVIGVEARATSSSGAQSSTPITDPTSLGSPWLKGPSSPRQRAVVKTPSWLASYPKALESPSQPLSPLSSVDLPLNHFRVKESYEEESCQGNTNITSETYLRPLVRNSYGHDVDPRSPLPDNAGAQALRLSSVNAFSFARPSPLTKTERLSADSYNMNSSLLLSKPI